MESCNSRQGLLVKSFSTITSSSDFDDDYRTTSPTSPTSTNNQHNDNNINNTAAKTIDNYGSTKINNNGSAKFFIGDDDLSSTTNQQHNNQFDNSCSCIDDDIHPTKIKESTTQSTIVMLDQQQQQQQSPSPSCSSPSPSTTISMNPYGGGLMIIKDKNFHTGVIIGSDDDDDDVDDDVYKHKHNNPNSNHHNSGISSGWQIFMAVMIAASGNFIAGLILDNSKTWNVFIYTPELYYLVPILLSLKGNLEMTMVARLSTLANMGMLKSASHVIRILLYNISLVQTQAIVVSFLASIVTLLAVQMEGESNIDLPDDTTTFIQDLPNVTTAKLSTIQQFQQIHGDGTALTRKCLLIFSTSLATANVACLLSTVIMITLTILLHYCNINPDNFVTALAASFGDIVTSFLIGLIGEFINARISYQPIDNNNDLSSLIMIDVPTVRYHDDLESPVFAIIIIMLFVVIFPLLAWFTCRDESNKEILIGLGAWIPIQLSMLIAFVSGFVLRFGAVEFNFMSLFQPLINGVGGNMAAITTSRYSTELHKQKAEETSNDHHNHQPQQQRDSLKTIMSTTFHSFLRISDNRNQMILIYILMAIVVHLFYGILAPVIHTSDHHQITWLFYLFYIPATILQVLLLLILTRFFVDFVWWLRYDPDTSAIPILTSMGDILGTVLLYLVFILLKLLNDQSAAPPLTNNDDFMIYSTINSNLNDNIKSTTLSLLFESITSTTTTNEPISMIYDNLTSATRFIRMIQQNQ